MSCNIARFFSLFFRNPIQCNALYQLYNSQALLNLRRGYYSVCDKTFETDFSCSDSLPQKAKSGNPAAVSGDTSGQPEEQQLKEGIGDSPDGLQTQHDDLLDDMYDEYEPTQKLEPLVNKKLCKIFQDLIWGMHKEEKKERCE